MNEEDFRKLVKAAIESRPIDVRRIAEILADTLRILFCEDSQGRHPED